MFRRASDARALEMKVVEFDVDVINWWKTIKIAQGSRLSRSMRQYYAQASNLRLPFLRCAKVI